MVFFQRWMSVAADPETDLELKRKLKWLIAGRLAASTVFIFGGFFWADPSHIGRFGSLPVTAPIFIVVLVLSAFYLLALRYASDQRTHAGFQLFLDVLLITWLVWATGNLSSPYSAFYIIIIAASSAFLGPRGALITSVACVGFFTIVTLTTAAGLVPSHAGTTEGPLTANAVQTIGLNDVAFLVVGLLSAKFAERLSRSDVRLMAATQTLANLRALHERIVESIRSGVITTDLQCRIYTFNRAAEEITGYTAENLRGKDASILFGEMSEHVEESIRAAENGEPSPRFDANCLTSDGFLLHVGFSIFPLETEAGEKTGYVITFQDLTEVRALEESARRKERMAAVGRVAAGIAHEIRNPLASMRGSIQLLRSDLEGNGSEGQLMEIILRESDRLNRIISDFLTYARPRKRSPENFDLREPLRETFALLRNSPEIHDQHSIEEELPKDAVKVNADASQLRQVFWNLSRNALQAMPNGGKLRVEMDYATRKRVRIRFSDTGTGMSPEQVNRLFEPFSTSTSGGTGLGLSIVYQIVRDHHGTINVHSREGEGTRITIELPCEARSQRSDSENQEVKPIATS